MTLNESGHPRPTPKELRNNLALLLEQLPTNTVPDSASFMGDTPQMDITIKFKNEEEASLRAQEQGITLDEFSQDLRRGIKELFTGISWSNRIRVRRGQSEHKERLMQNFRVLLQQSPTTNCFQEFVLFEVERDYNRGRDEEGPIKPQLTWVLDEDNSEGESFFGPRAKVIERLGYFKLARYLFDEHALVFDQQTSVIPGWELHSMNIGKRLEELRTKLQNIYEKWPGEFFERYKEPLLPTSVPPKED